MIDPLTFVALDLETTGLSHENDTIIEVAAVKFSLERRGDIFHAVDIEERSMLIDPERPIDEHISMITGITDAMVQGKSKWREVRQRVESFIGTDSIILGHNVLFDVRMLGGHGIDLSRHTILDTFELSELFSQDAESLNLGFLGQKYGLDSAGEHRALDDTKLSIALFLKYLHDIATMDPSHRTLWRYARSRDRSRMIDTLLTIVGDEGGEGVIDIGSKKSLLRHKGVLSRPKESHVQYIETPLSWRDDDAIIRGALQDGKVLLFASSRKQLEWLEKRYKDKKIAYHRDQSEIISLEMLDAWTGKSEWSRKETILILKLHIWLKHTESGRVDEIKWYGEEESYRSLFRASDTEWNIYHEKNANEKRDADIILASTFSRDAALGALSDSHSTLIVRDIMDLDDALRVREGREVSFSNLRRLLSTMRGFLPSGYEEVETALGFLEEIFSSVKPRPKGPDLFVPGDFGETYFYSIEDLWHRGYIWLVWATDILERFIRDIDESGCLIGPIERGTFRLFREGCRSIIDIARTNGQNKNIIVHIKENEMKIHIIHRSMKSMIESFFSLQGGKNTIITGYGISAVTIRQFLSDEYGISHEITPGEKIGSHLHLTESLPSEGAKIILLGTNLKQLRALSQTLKSQYPQHILFTQGVSGGKSKIRTLFLKSEMAILVGLIDTWKDESDVWQVVDHVHILKVPFEPPTDPYYLARTVGISNNFENYSLPIALHTLMTLIGRIKSANSDSQISLADEKIQIMNWGKIFRDELF